jgi:hypothetical protein
MHGNSVGAGLLGQYCGLHRIRHFGATRLA